MHVGNFAAYLLATTQLRTYLCCLHGLFLAFDSLLLNVSRACILSNLYPFPNLCPSPPLAVSSAHAKLTATRNGLQIVDLGSTNGTFVDGKKVTRTNLQDGDSVTFADVTFKVQQTGGAPAARASSPVPKIGSIFVRREAPEPEAPKRGSMFMRREAPETETPKRGSMFKRREAPVPEAPKRGSIFVRREAPAKVCCFACDRHAPGDQGQGFVQLVPSRPSLQEKPCIHNMWCSSRTSSSTRDRSVASVHGSSTVT